MNRLLILALIIVVTLIALPVLTYPLGRDQGEFATIARGILDGRAPYTDLWNPKPPAIFYVYAAAMMVFGRTVIALRAIDLLIVPTMMLMMMRLGTRITGDRRTGLWAALVLAVFYFTETFWTLTQNDGIALLPMSAAMLAMFHAADHAGTSQGWRWAFVAGLLSALTVWFKYPFALFVLALVIGFWLNVRKPGERLFVSLFRTRREIMAFIIGGLLVGVGGIVYLAAIGSLDALLESIRVTSRYTRLTYNLDDFTSLMRTSLTFRWGQWRLLLLIVALWPVLRWRRRDHTPDHHAAWHTVSLWVVAALVIMLVQARGFDYHWLPLLPPLALLAGDSLRRLTNWIVSVGAVREPPLRGIKVDTMAPVLIAVGLLLYMTLRIWPTALPYITGHESRLEYYARFQGGEFIADESWAVSEFLQERVAPGDSLFIWGFRPEVYYLTGLNPATRFIFQFPLIAEWYPRAWQQETVDVLWAALPPYVLVMQVDYMPLVTGRHEDSHQLLLEYTALSDWLNFNYERDTEIGNFLIWRRTS